MANAKPKLIPINLDKQRNLLVDFNAIATAEELTGRNLLGDGGWANPSARDVRAILFACLKHEDETLTLEKVGAMLHPGNINEVVNALNGVVEAALPEPGDDSGKGQTTIPPRKPRKARS